ncbi:hypothetical protein WMY93_023136 [Mugilogobius chulae]|uniref:Hyaluronidase n=1 Tax=Mugilogobius chulae TaxID=88201 RepID=A0AAW0NDY2_9GOBI
MERPTDHCHTKDLNNDLITSFQAVSSPKDPGQFLTLFYEKTLGQYPKYDRLTPLFGGLPQNGNLKSHLSKAAKDMDKYISHRSLPGLAVIDWEGWRPLWDQNWTSKLIYQNLSIKKVNNTQSELSGKGIVDEAKKQFEKAARRFMQKTLKLGQAKYPKYKWGFYLYPDCFNYQWLEVNYTGKCSEKTQMQNNQMLWLWNTSTALFPSIYLDIKLKNTPRVALFVRNRVQEALRVAALARPSRTAPVYVYTWPLYRDQSEVFLSQTDLVHTVGESAALGAAGIIMWGASADYNNQGSCKSLSSYLSSTLAPYLANVTAATILCGRVLCQGKGRCVRKHYDSAHYLHLSPANFWLHRCDRKYVAVGTPSKAQLNEWERHFTCQCFSAHSCGPKLVYPDSIQEIWVHRTGG